MEAPSDRTGDKLAAFLAGGIRLIATHGPAFLLTAGSVLLAFGVDSHPLPFYIGAILSIIGFIGALINTPRIERIIARERRSQNRARERTLALKTIMETTLHALVGEMGVGMTNSRISVYRHTSGSFFLIARTSGSLQLRKPGRLRYPDHQGVIGSTWDIGQHIVTDLPESREEWERIHVERWEFDRECVTGMSMQARSILGKRIDLSGTSPKPAGVLVIESTAPRGVNGTHLDQLEEQSSWQTVSLILEEVVKCLDEDDRPELDSSADALVGNRER